MLVVVVFTKGSDQTTTVSAYRPTRARSGTWGKHTRLSITGTFWPNNRGLLLPLRVILFSLVFTIAESISRNKIRKLSSVFIISNFC